MSKGNLDMILLALSWYLSHPILLQQSYKALLYFYTHLSIDFCQLTLLLQVILLRMITRSILKQLHAQYNYTNYIAITLLNYTQLSLNV